MGTNLSARQVALKQWREDVTEAPIERHDNVKHVLIVWLNIQIAITKGDYKYNGRLFRCRVLRRLPSNMLEGLDVSVFRKHTRPRPVVLD